MRTDAKIGFAIGGVLLAVLTVYAIVVPKHSKKQANTVALVKGDTPTGADTPVPQTMLGTDGSSVKETPVQPLKELPSKEEPAKDPKDVPPAHNELPTVKTTTPSGPLGGDLANSDRNMGGGATDLTRRDPKPGDRTVGRIKPNTKVKPIPSVDTTDTASETDRFYTIQAGQTLSKIAYEVYGNPRCFVAIQRENRGIDPNHLKVGTRIKLPDISLPTEGVADAHLTDRAKKAVEVESPVAATSDHTYTVQAGDSLYAIARKQLGSGKKSDLIYALNKDVIGPDKSRLKLGMQLKLPALAE